MQQACPKLLLCTFANVHVAGSHPCISNSGAEAASSRNAFKKLVLGSIGFPEFQPISNQGCFMRELQFALHCYV